ncbi:MAG: rhamnulokinase [Lachnospiraceae bacterium]|nr:rhamnulokinase [Lachnospiraceae bacterium]
MKYYLAIDIGASSGRHILFHMENGRIVTEEIHRFENGMEDRDGTLIWDTEKLFREIVAGMKKCGEAGKIPDSVGIDTWGVDFVLLDENDRLIGNAVGYRDARNQGMDREVYRLIPEEKLYARTGIQKAAFNTIYQLMAVKLKTPEQLEEARTLLMMPDYFHFLLTGVKAAEYTEATTSQLVSPITKDWDRELIRLLGYPEEIFPQILEPGTTLGEVRDEIAEEIGYRTKVVLPACHDTGSAVLAVPALDDTVYISSGTWSLMGIERMEAELSEESRKLNFTNEGGYQYRFRYLKNIMGLWMIQCVRKELGKKYSYDELSKGAAKCDIPSLVPVNDDRFLAPASMTEEILACLKEQGARLPEGPFELAAVVYNSLADCYKDTVEEIRRMSGKDYPCINIVGGGSNAEYLDQLTADRTGRTVYAGPAEGTAIGNAMVQMLADGVFRDLKEARRAVFDSFGVKTYYPQK